MSKSISDDLREVWNNKNLKWLDPCCGMGDFPIAVYLRLMEGLKDVIIDVLPCHVFYDYMKIKGKVGSSHKFPRVLKKNQLLEWESYLKMKK